MSQKQKEFYELQSIKSEIYNNNSPSLASTKLPSTNIDPNYQRENYEDDEDFTNDNIDVESDSENELQISNTNSPTSKRSYHTLTSSTQEWSRFMRRSTSPATRVATANDSSSSCHDEGVNNQHNSSSNSKAMKINDDPNTVVVESRNLKRVYLPDEDESEFFNESFTSQNLLDLSERKRGKFGSGKGFSIENLIGRMVEDR